jgi:hypothetical protein
VTLDRHSVQVPLDIFMIPDEGYSAVDKWLQSGYKFMTGFIVILRR